MTPKTVSDSPAAPTAPVLPKPSRPEVLSWLGLALLLTLQYGMFRQYAEREVTWCYPRGYDQTVYLGRAYACYEQVLRGGPLSGVLWALRQPVANGLVFEAEAGLLFVVLGPSRLSALTLNFAHFALFQLALAATLRWRTRRWGPAFLGVGLLLMAATPFGVAGGLSYFALDLAAMCLYGVFLCAVVRSGAFASWRWSAVVGATAAWLVLTRYLSVVYLACVFAGLLALLGLGLLRGEPARRRLIGARLVGLLVAGLTLVAAAGPVLAWKWPMIRAYYLGQFENAENLIRGQEFGASDLAGRLVFYAKSVAFDHAGLPLMGMAGIVLLTALVLALTHRLARGRVECVGPTPAGDHGPVLAFLGLCLLAPLTALTLFASPSPIVGNIVVAALVWLVLAAALALLPASTAGWRAGAALAALGLGAGCYHQAYQFTRPLPLWGTRAEMEEVTKLYERIGDCCRLRRWDSPRVAVAAVSDDLLPSLVSPVVYERQGVLLQPAWLLGGGVNAVREEAAVRAVRESDVAIVPVADKGSDLYPFVRCMREYRPRLLAACRETHLDAGRFRLPWGEVVLFVRPSVRVEGLSFDWISSNGVSLIADASDLKAFPRIELRGRYFAEHLGKLPNVQARLTAPGREPRKVPVRISASGSAYRLIAEVDPDELPESSEVRLHLDFDSWFIPAERPDLFGSHSPDTRRLVLLAPDAVALRRAP